MVAPFLVERMLADPQNGGRITHLTGPKSFGRFAATLFRKRAVLTAVGAD